MFLITEWVALMRRDELDNRLLLYYISAEASRPSLSVFGPTSRRFWLPEQPGSYPEQGGACPERSGSDQGARRSDPGVIPEGFGSTP